MHRLKARVVRLTREAAEAGMNTAEYAMGTIAAVAFAGLLLKVLSSAKTQAALAGIVEKALS
ncbi:hypothetical protein Acsp02_54710 [Actinoplanes sp. NBRC 103695]|nr:hypothetical protein Acsp02_54710 [Actinoplanes sp. NBRC 103695]